MRYKRFGWRHFETIIPEEWEITAEGGSSRKSYLRLEDEQMIRMELRWERIKPEKRPDVRKQVEDTLENLRKRVEAAKLPFKRISLRSTTVNEHEGLTYHVRGGTELLGVAWYCTESQRLFMIHIHFRREEYETIKEVFQKLIESSVCHGKEWWLWSAYALSFVLPEQYYLSEYKLLSTYGRMSFASKQDAWFIVAYQGMADVIIGEEYGGILEWYRKFFVKDSLKQFGQFKLVSVEDTNIKGHEGFRIIQKPWVSIFRRVSLESYLWLCEPSNRAYVLTYIAPRRIRPHVALEAERVLDSIRCH